MRNYYMLVRFSNCYAVKVTLPSNDKEKAIILAQAEMIKNCLDHKWVSTESYSKGFPSDLEADFEVRV